MLLGTAPRARLRPRPGFGAENRRFGFVCPGFYPIYVPAAAPRGHPHLPVQSRGDPLGSMQCLPLPAAPSSKQGLEITIAIGLRFGQL